MKVEEPERRVVKNMPCGLAGMIDYKPTKPTLPDFYLPPSTPTLSTGITSRRPEHQLIGLPFSHFTTSVLNHD